MGMLGYEEEERSVGEVAETLYSKVTHYHAQIGHSVKREALNELEWKLLSEAKDLFHRNMYEEALNTFTHCLAVTEKTRNSRDLAVRGAILHNIASCLHHLGQYTAAQQYYEQAIDSFQKCKTPMYEKMLYGNTNQRRVDFVKERLIDISWGRKPDIDKYLDENARKQPVPQLPAGVTTGSATNLSRDWGNDDEQAGPTEIDRPLPSWTGGGSSRRGFAPVGIPEDEGGASHAAEDDEDDAAQEQARKEWLQYYLQVENWDKAAELVVTPAEREDLEYLKGYQKRAAEVRRSARPAPQGLGPDARERDMYELNDAAIASTHKQPPSYPSKSAASAPRDDSDDDML